MSSDLVVVETIPDPFLKGGLTRELRPVVHGGTIADYWGGDPTWVCVWNGQEIPSDQWHTVRPGPDDSLVFVRNVEGVEIAALILNVAVTSWSAIALGTAINVGLAVGLSLVANKLFGVGDLGDDLLPDQDRSVHTFEGIQTQSGLGAYLPVVYGRHKVGGHIIGNMIRSNLVPPEGTPQPAHEIRPSIYEFILALCEGEIVAIHEVLVNGNDISNYQNGGELIAEARLGTSNQQETFLVSTLGGVSNVVPVGLVLENETDVVGGIEDDWVTSSMTRDAESVLININHTDGLYFGTSQPGWVTWGVRYKPFGADDSEYSAWVNFPVVEIVGEPFQSYCQIDFPTRGRYDLQVRKTTERADYLPESLVNAIEWDSFTEVSDGSYAYPNTALVAARMYQIADLAGGQPNFVVTITGKKIQRYDLDTETWVNDSPNYKNPAWVFVDLLTSSRYGKGKRKRPVFDRDKHFDLVNIVEFAEWCAELVDDGQGGLEARCEFDGVFEGGESLWDAVTRVLGSARAWIVRRGNQFGIGWHRDRPHTQLFNRKNMAPGSFSQKFLPLKNRVTQYEVEFLNAEQDYVLDVVPVPDYEGIAEVGVNIHELKLFGITRKSQAMREGKFRLNIQRYASRVVSWQAPWQAVTCEVGDIVRVANEKVGWGVAAGIVRAATASTITIDQDFELLEGYEYDVEVQHQADDTLEVRKIISPAGVYVAGDTLTVDQDWTATPEKDARWILGQVTGPKNLVLVTGISAADDKTFQFTGMRYDPRLHDDTIAAIEDPIDTSLPSPGAIPPCLANPPTVTEVFEGGEARFRVSWTYAPTTVVGGGLQSPIGGAKVYYRRITGGSITTWQVAGQVGYPVSQLTIPGLTAGETFVFKVLQTSPSGAHLPPSECDGTAPITLEGFGPVPAKIENVQVVQSGPELHITWDPLPTAPAFYQVRRGESWVLSRFVGDTPTPELVTEKWSPPLTSQPAKETFWVRAVSGTGLYGEAGKVTTNTLALWFGTTAAATQDEFTLGWPGTKTNLEVNGDGFLELTDTGSQGTYETGAIDLGSISNFRVGAVPWAKVTGGPTLGTLTETYGSLFAKRWSFEGPVDPAKWIASLQVEIRTATSAGGLTSAAWVPMIGAVGNFYGIRYVELRLTLATSDPDWEPLIDYLAITAEELP